MRAGKGRARRTDRRVQPRVTRAGSSGPWQRPPVFPDVGSMMVSPGFRVPSRSASSIIRRLMRSFTLPPALKNSHLATGARDAS